MKTKRTIRTLRRADIPEASIGFAGYTPNGKQVQRIARQRRAERRILAELPLAARSAFFRTNISARVAIKAASAFLRAPAIVQSAWIKGAV